MNDSEVILTCQHCKLPNKRALPYKMVPNDVCDECGMIMRPVDMILTCPACNARHIDEGVFATRHHHTHACQSCGLVWRPAKEFTRGVQFLPGYKN